MLFLFIVVWRDTDIDQDLCIFLNYAVVFNILNKMIWSRSGNMNYETKVYKDLYLKNTFLTWNAQITQNRNNLKCALFFS